MEVFSAFGLLMLVGLALPILLIFSALLFDLAVVVYVMITSRHSQRKQTRATSLAGGRARVEHRRIVFNH
jgi:membrane protein implicated in regulation of membrane protease activity